MGLGKRESILYRFSALYVLIETVYYDESKGFREWELR